MCEVTHLVLGDALCIVHIQREGHCRLMLCLKLLVCCRWVAGGCGAASSDAGSRLPAVSAGGAILLRRRRPPSSGAPSGDHRKPLHIRTPIL